ncbi:hypothetical protein LCGC14_1699340, partial [marine sediment metagenome]
MAVLFGVNMLPSIAWGLHYREFGAVVSLLWAMG